MVIQVGFKSLGSFEMRAVRCGLWSKHSPDGFMIRNVWSGMVLPIFPSRLHVFVQ